MYISGYYWKACEKPYSMIKGWEVHQNNCRITHLLLWLLRSLKNKELNRKWSITSFSHLRKSMFCGDFLRWIGQELKYTCWQAVEPHMKWQSSSWRYLGVGNVVHEPRDAWCLELPHFLALKMLINIWQASKMALNWLRFKTHSLSRSLQFKTFIIRLWNCWIIYPGKYW